MARRGTGALLLALCLATQLVWSDEGDRAGGERGPRADAAGGEAVPSVGGAANELSANAQRAPSAEARAAQVAATPQKYPEARAGTESEDVYATVARELEQQQLAERLSRLGVESAEALFSRVDLMRTGKNGTAKDSVQAVRLLSELAAFPIGAPDAAAKAARLLGDM